MSSTDRTPRIGVVTVSYGSESVLDGLLTSIPASTSEPVDVVVVDNRPSDAIRENAERRGARYLPLPENPGYGTAVNTAVASFPPSIAWVLVTNPDVALGESAITILVASAETNDRIGSIGPAVRDPDGTIFPSARRVPSLRLGIGHAVFGVIWKNNPWSKAYREETSPYRRVAGWLSGSCFLIRRIAFEQVQGFDPGYFMYFEDVDLGYRLGRAGWLNVYEPGASVVHSGGHSTASVSAEMIKAHHRSAQQFIDSKYHGLPLAPVRLAIAVGLRIRSWIIRRGID